MSGYLDEDQTLVLFSPGITGFMPTSGFASAGQGSVLLQLVPGTEAKITGSGLADGIAYLNGVAMERDWRTQKRIGWASTTSAPRRAT